MRAYDTYALPPPRPQIARRACFVLHLRRFPSSQLGNVGTWMVLDQDTTTCAYRRDTVSDAALFSNIDTCLGVAPFPFGLCAVVFPVLLFSQLNHSISICCLGTGRDGQVLCGGLALRACASKRMNAESSRSFFPHSTKFTLLQPHLHPSALTRRLAEDKNFLCLPALPLSPPSAPYSLSCVLTHSPVRYAPALALLG